LQLNPEIKPKKLSSRFRVCTCAPWLRQGCHFLIVTRLHSQSQLSALIRACSLDVIASSHTFFNVKYIVVESGGLTDVCMISHYVVSLRA